MSSFSSASSEAKQVLDPDDGSIHMEYTQMYGGINTDSNTNSNRNSNASNSFNNSHTNQPNTLPFPSQRQSPSYPFNSNQVPSSCDSTAHQNVHSSSTVRDMIRDVAPNASDSMITRTG